MKTVQIQCLVCQKFIMLTFSKKGYAAWKKGQHIQNAIPELTAGERELLISQICESCFDKKFGSLKT